MVTDTETERRLLESGVSALERNGYGIERPTSGRFPDAVGVREAGDGATRDGQNGATDDGRNREERTVRVAVEPVPTADADPTFVLSRLANDASNGRFALFVVEDDAGARACADILRSPPFVREEDELGRRTFYEGPGRISLDGGGLALHRSDDPTLRWTEEGTDDEKRLVLRDEGGDGGDEVVAVLPNADALRAPDAETFRYSYAREADKRLRVRTADGREVGAYSGFAAMRRDAYVPVPMPLVPEHLFEGAESVRREWAILVADEGGENGAAVSEAAESFRTLGPGADDVF